MSLIHTNNIKKPLLIVNLDKPGSTEFISNAIVQLSRHHGIVT